MRPLALEYFKSALKMDPATPAQRLILLGILGAGGTLTNESRTQRIEKIVRRREVADMFGRSLRFVDLLAASGILRKVRLPGRQRAVGFRRADVEALIAAEPTTYPQDGGIRS